MRKTHFVFLKLGNIAMDVRLPSIGHGIFLWKVPLALIPRIPSKQRHRIVTKYFSDFDTKLQRFQLFPDERNNFPESLCFLRFYVYMCVNGTPWKLEFRKKEKNTEFGRRIKDGRRTGTKLFELNLRPWRKIYSTFVNRKSFTMLEHVPKREARTERPWIKENNSEFPQDE